MRLIAGAGVFQDPGHCLISMAPSRAQSDSTFEPQGTYLVDDFHFDRRAERSRCSRYFPLLRSTTAASMTTAVPQ
jgi:hypothetical protein